MGFILNGLAVLVAGIIKDEGDGLICILDFDLLEEFDDDLGIDESGVDAETQFKADGVDCSQDIDAIASGPGTNEKATHRPHHAAKV